MICWFAKNIRGSMIIEAAILLPVLLIALAGILELIEYSDAKRRMDRIASELADVIGGTQDVAQFDREFPQLQHAARQADQPHDPAVLLHLCRYDSDSGQRTIPRTKRWGEGKCGFGNGEASLPKEDISCPLPEPGRMQVAHIVIQCAYHPVLPILKLFDTAPILRVTIAHPLDRSYLPVVENDTP